MNREVEGLLRELAPQVLGALVRRFGHFDAAEDAVQEALLAAATQWPADGALPDRPKAWLITVASRRLTDQLRADQARRRREDRTVLLDPSAVTTTEVAAHDDTLTLLFLCCHPALTPPSQVALTLRAVGGLTTAEIARALLSPEATTATRISRAKQTIRNAGATFRPPPPDELDERVRVVLHVLYLIFNEGYAATSGEELQRVELTTEAIRLARTAHRLLPDDGEVAGLLALLLLLDARRSARTTDAGDLVPLDDQDRSQWDRATIDEATTLLERTMATAPLGPY
ncbi:MAG TPA: sigma-70 family RNA polymerase sigma factor, partial [Acidimicrobiales bacterium]|nr:sigma-70 family RNA polymerase sigma factor [Acidimicrobiales bacterium]